ncbi:hypothetical protein [Vibrio barjaei]|uniref:hypothetical protein n=1 Tax=Vibrio barjaei TaxID=1676683 RepID=UPI0022834E5D|nr:hypothetical protein [Vibrio barjaei]MCY9871165.1 hypothetical protein [Vibrio barjaei]
MKQLQKINGHMFNLLIKREMDNFSVIEARDALMTLSGEFENRQEARKYVYRQILAFERKGWLVATGSNRSKKYQKTELMNSLHMTSHRLKNNPSEVFVSKFSHENFDLKVLQNEKNEYEGELAIVLSEIEECQLLMERFPMNKDLFLAMFIESKELSAKLLAKINVRTKAIQASKREASSSC